MPFNINSWEILVILMLFVLLFGPEKLPEVAIQIGRLLRDLREATAAATEEITRELHSAAEDQKEAAEDVRRIGDSARRILQDASDSVTAGLSPAAAVAKSADRHPASKTGSESTEDAAAESAETAASTLPDDEADSAADASSIASQALRDDDPEPESSADEVDLLLDGPDRMIPDEER